MIKNNANIYNWYIYANIMVHNGQNFPGMGGLAIFGTFAAYAASFGYAGIKAVLKVKAGDNTGAELPKFTIFGLGFLGAILVFFYNIIGLVIFDQRFWYELNGKIFVLILIGGMLVFLRPLYHWFFLQSKSCQGKGSIFMGRFRCFHRAYV